MKFLILILILSSQFTFAKETAEMIFVNQNGEEKRVTYDNTYPQCVSLKFFIGNSIGFYKSAYTGQYSLQKADSNVSSEAINTLNSIREKNLPLPFSYSDLISSTQILKNMIFTKKIVDNAVYSTAAYNQCVKILVKNGYENYNNNNYDKKINYSEGEDKIPKVKITKVEQVCNNKDFPELMRNARQKIIDFANFRNLDINRFLLKVNYKSINRLAEDMLQAGLDDGIINDQFLWDTYNSPARGLRIGNIQPRCIINQ